MAKWVSFSIVKYKNSFIVMTNVTYRWYIYIFNYFHYFTKLFELLSCLFKLFPGNTDYVPILTSGNSVVYVMYIIDFPYWQWISECDIITKTKISLFLSLSRKKNLFFKTLTVSSSTLFYTVSCTWCTFHDKNVVYLYDTFHHL